MLKKSLKVSSFAFLAMATLLKPVYSQSAPNRMINQFNDAAKHVPNIHASKFTNPPPTVDWSNAAKQLDNTNFQRNQAAAAAQEAARRAEREAANRAAAQKAQEESARVAREAQERARREEAARRLAKKSPEKSKELARRGVVVTKAKTVNLTNTNLGKLNTAVQDAKRIQTPNLTGKAKREAGAAVRKAELNAQTQKHFEEKAFHNKQNSLSAASAINRIELTKDLATRQHRSSKGVTIAGTGAKTEFRDARRVVNQYGGQPGDWSKKSSISYTAPDREKISSHWVENKKTGKREEFKLKKSIDTSTDKK